MRTLGRDEGSLPISRGSYGGGVGGVWTARCRICATFKWELGIGYPKDSEGCKEMACLLDSTVMLSSADWRS